MENVLIGLEMEILDGAYPLLHSVETGSDPNILFRNTDVIGNKYKKLISILSLLF